MNASHSSALSPWHCPGGFVRARGRAAQRRCARDLRSAGRRIGYRLGAPQVMFVTSATASHPRRAAEPCPMRLGVALVMAGALLAAGAASGGNPGSFPGTKNAKDRADWRKALR